MTVTLASHKPAGQNATVHAHTAHHLYAAQTLCGDHPEIDFTKQWITD
jgi:hypothetical protein